MEPVIHHIIKLGNDRNPLQLHVLKLIQEKVYGDGTNGPIRAFNDIWNVVNDIWNVVDAVRISSNKTASFGIWQNYLDKYYNLFAASYEKDYRCIYYESLSDAIQKLGIIS